MRTRLSIILALVSGSTAIGQQKPAPAATPVQTNLLNCLKGLSGCDVSALSPQELKQVAEASQKRNVDYCLSGSTLCDPTRLDSTQAKDVVTARYRRNLDKCLNGSATCDPVILSPKDAASAHAAAAGRNFDRCLSGAPSCDPNLPDFDAKCDGTSRRGSAQPGSMSEWLVHLRSLTLIPRRSGVSARGLSAAQSRPLSGSFPDL